MPSLQDTSLLTTYSQKNLADSGVSLTGLVGYWKLDGDATDSSGNSYNLSGTAPAYVTALFNQGGDFESTSSNYVGASAANCNITTAQTWSCWFKPESNTINQALMYIRNSAGGNARGIFVTTAGRVRWDLDGLTTGNGLSPTEVLQNGFWYHIVCVYDPSNVVKVFINGVKSETTTTGTPGTISANFVIGRGGDRSEYYADGVMDDVAVWSRALSDAEVAALYKAGGNCVGYWKLDQTEDTNTKLLLHFNGADAATSTIESSTGKAVTFVNQAQIDTAQKKFGSASLLLDGTTDSITLADSADWAFGTGSFTIDMWLRFNVLPTNGGSSQAIINQYVDTNNYWSFSAYNNAGTYMWLFYHKTGGTITITVEKNSTGLSANTWYHVALVRNGNDFMIFQDGVQQGTTVTDTDSMADFATVLRIGDRSLEAGFNGWIDELRVVKGTAKWTANFTPSTTPYSFQTDDYSANGYHLVTGTQPTNVTGLYGQAGDFESTSSQYMALSSDLGITTGAYSLSMWINIQTQPSTGNIYSLSEHGDSGANIRNWIRYSDITGVKKIQWNRQRENVANDAFTIDYSLTTGVWYHVVYSYNGTTLYGYVNGSNMGNVASSGNGASGVDIDYIYLACARKQITPAPNFFSDVIIDDVAIFNRALTDAEVLSIYVSGAPKIIFF